VTCDPSRSRSVSTLEPVFGLIGLNHLIPTSSGYIGWYSAANSIVTEIVFFLLIFLIFLIFLMGVYIQDYGGAQRISVQIAS
jgi:hypothetical protein